MLALQRVGQTVMLLVATLWLAGCAEDWGPDQHGQTVSADTLKSQWLIVNYWAEWCAPCRTEIPELNRLSEKLHDQPVTVVGVNFDSLQGERLSRAAQSFGIRFTVLAQDPARRLALPRSEVLPVTYIIDPQGVVRERLIGEQTAAGLYAQVQRLRGQ